MLALKSGCGKLLQVLLAWDGGFRPVLPRPGAGYGLGPSVVCAAVVDAPSGAANPVGYGEQGAAQE